jgi:hypothetical protein
MRSIKALWVAGALGLGAGLAADAEAANPGKLDDTADLLAFCEETADPAQDLGFCNGFIAGTGLFYLELVRADAIKPIACKDPTPALAEIRHAFVTWARAHPEHMDTKPVDGFWRAMADTYPCTQQP